jgi:hypothetical protein
MIPIKGHRILVFLQFYTLDPVLWGQQKLKIDESSKLIKLTDLPLHFPHFDAVIACLAK